VSARLEIRVSARTLHALSNGAKHVLAGLRQRLNDSLL